MIKIIYCNRCNKPVHRETDKSLKKEYKYYCPHCDENMYSFETHKAKGGDVRA